MTEKTKNNLLEHYRNCIRLSSLQLFNLRREIKEKDELIHRIKHSRSWKLTLPVRVIGYIVQGNFFKKYPLKVVQKRLLEVYKEDGYRGVYDKVVLHFPIISLLKKKLQHYRNKQTPSEENTYIDNVDLISNYKFSDKNSTQDYPLILIIGEVTLPQCYKYRIQQKLEHLERLGWSVKVVDWREQKTALSFLQICQEVIFYRVPAFPNVIEQLNEAKRLALNPWWEVDDLIVDQERYAECGFISQLSKEETDLLFFGSDLFRKTMLSCGRAIASTQALADVMYQAGVPEVHVIENALDQDTLRIAQKLYNPENQYQQKDKVIIVYGSGTNTHNADFLIASGGILAALKKEPILHLWIVGELDLPVDFQDVASQIQYIPLQSYEQYLRLLAKADIAIAPLEPILFNDAKSNIKYLEASILGIPSVCSPRQAFRTVIKDSENGLLANTPEEWEEKLLLLARDVNIRASMGRQAYKTVLERYSPQKITTEQVEPVFGRINETTTRNNNLKILVVNIYYAPYSFGGATFVAEKMAQYTQQKDNVEVAVFTSRPIKDVERGLCRYEDHGSLIYSVDLTPLFHDSQKIYNIEVVEPFEMVLDAVKPDIVHFHAIQEMGLQMLTVCQNRAIPYVITLHDSWWLCNRHFMVKSNGKYCFQNKIDLRICQACEPQTTYLTERYMMMKQGLQNAALLLSPSETHRQLYIANDIDEALLKVNRNGIVRPKKTRPSRPKNTPLRFGFVAGDEVIKGAVVVQKAFKSLTRSDWELKIIDSKINMGYDPIDTSKWRMKGKVVTLPPYDEQSKDDFFYGIDILLFPSQWKESYGMTVREALLRDVWVICSHPGGQSEDIVDGVNGNYVSLTGDVAELKRVIENLLDHALMFDHYQNPHKDHIATLEEQADELLGYYRQIKDETEKTSLL